MKHVVILLLLLITVSLTAQKLPPLPSCYHTYAQIETELDHLQNQYPTIARRYTIGHTQQDNLPIYAFKISDNVEQEEQEPAVLLIGQVHAEEVLGVETTMSNLNQMLANHFVNPYAGWIANLQMWFIPTLNPEGHTVVTDNLDPSYRKNKHDVNNNGSFDYSPLVGYDEDGVDLNRNLPFNWCHGDTLLQPGGLEVYDYYRGEYPFSESETQALDAFCFAHKPVFCIIWHSSRTGTLSEKVYYPFNYANVRPSPDLLLAQQIGQGVASQITTENGSGTYEASASLGRKATVNDWMYVAYGTIAMTIECGTSNLQPDSSLMVSTVNRCSNGVWWLLNRALPLSAGLVSNSMLTGTIKDAVTQEPLEAEVIVVEKHAPYFGPRLSFAATGRYWRPIINGGPLTIKYRKKGYAERTDTNVSIVNSSWTIRHVTLQPLQPANLEIYVHSGQTPVEAKLVLYDVTAEEYPPASLQQLQTYVGKHRVEISAPGYFPFVDSLNVVGNQAFDINLSPATPAFSEDWENGTANWTIEGPWVVQNQLAATGHAITDSWGGWGFYTENCNVWIKTTNPVALPTGNRLMLKFDEHLYTEFVYDSVQVEVSSDNQNWQTIYSKTGQYDWWHPVYVPLDSLTGQNRYFRFRLKDNSTESSLTDPGWTLDNIEIISGNATPVASDTIPNMPELYVFPNYPNPFNPETTLRFFVRSQVRVKVQIYNLKGQLVRNLTDAPYNAGTHSIVWNGKNDREVFVGSGLYFGRIMAGKQTKGLKMILMK